MSGPTVSVIVPARNASALLARALDGLAAGDPSPLAEVVVVDDASTDDTARVAAERGARVVRLERQSGPAAARNAGIAASRGELLVFLDADCVPAPGWLEALMVALEDADLVMGAVLPDPSAPVGAFDRTLRRTAASPLFETANLGVRRSTAAAAGGFEAFAPVAGRPELGLRPRVEDGHFGEDVVFGWRARRQGARVAFVADAVVHHAVFARGPRGYVAERWRMRYFPALVREVPELRDVLPGRLFLSRRTARFDLAVLGALLGIAARSGWPLFLALPYARRDLGSGRRRVLHAPVLVAGDVVGLAALMRGAVAARRLLL